MKRNYQCRQRFLWVAALLVSGMVVMSAVGVGCSSTPTYKAQAYAKLPNSKEFEEEYALVWKASVAALSESKILEKEQEDGVIRTDWVYSTSNDKYFEYTVNGFPRKKYLQTRYQYRVELVKQPFSVKVTVKLTEELENLRSDGSFDSWGAVGEVDSGRANDLLKQIELKILSLPN